MLTTSHVVFREMFASADKLEAVPILCVEWLVLPLFCMNASQSAIIFLWRNLLVLLLFLSRTVVMDCTASGCTTIGYPLVFH